MKYYLGLDNGGTTTKAVLYSENGEEIAVVNYSTEAITPMPGFDERDMTDMWESNSKAIREVLKKADVSADDVLAVSLCGHGKGLYLWGKDGKPVRNGILSADNRAYAYPKKWKEDGTEDKVFKISLQHILACQPVSLLAWLKDHEPEVMDRIEWVFECKDYVRFRLTGKALAELTDYSGANLVNLNTREYDDELLRLFGLECIKDALPPLCKSTDICGTVTAEAAAATGLKEGTPVVGGMFDIDACALAVDVTDPENICMIAGTWSINEYPSKLPVTDGSVLMNSLFCLPEYYLIEESSATSAGNHAWFIKQLLSEAAEAAKTKGSDIYAEMNEWVESIKPEEFVPVFLPFVMESNVQPNAKGSFVGISTNHTRKHLLRSVYEGVAFSHRYHLEKLLKTRETPPRVIRLAGGVTRSAVWVQMFADIMQYPIETVDVNETGALGSVIAASVAIGQHKSMAEATAAMVHVSKAVMPRKEYADIYDRKYELYLKTISCLDGLWDDMQKLIEESVSES